MVVEWRARNDDFSDFLGFVKKSYSHISKYCGGVLISPDWIFPDRYVPKWKNEKIAVKTQGFKKFTQAFTLQKTGKKHQDVYF
jgi:hypothetical protein